MLLITQAGEEGGVTRGGPATSLTQHQSGSKANRVEMFKLYDWKMTTSGGGGVSSHIEEDTVLKSYYTVISWKRSK